MSIPSRYIVLVVAALLCGARAEAQTTKSPALDADVQFSYTLPNGQQFTKQAHLYRSSSGKVRQDTANGSSITDPETGTVTLLVPSKKEARVVTIPAELRKPPSLGAETASRVSAAVKPFEETTINGHRIAKTRITGGKGETREVWTATDLGIVTFARIQANGVTTTQELKNLSVREPDAKVFDVPSDYTVIREPTRSDVLNSRAPPSENLPFGTSGTIVPVQPTK